MNDREKERSDEDEEESVSSYWLSLRKWEGTGNWKRKHWIAIGGKIAFEDVMELL